MASYGSPGFFDDLKNLRFSNIGNFLKDLPYILKTSPTDVKIAYYSVFAGILLIIAQFIVLLVL